MKCSQCGTPAVVEMGGHPFCLSCAEKYRAILQSQNDALADQYNYLLEMAEATTGVFGVMPRMKRSQPIMQKGPSVTNYNNIHVEKSNVGVINTGSLQQLDLTMEKLKVSGGESEKLVSEIARLTDAILEAKELQPKEKNDAAELLNSLLTQATHKKEHRMSGGVLRSLVRGLQYFVEKSPAVLALWDRVGPILQRALGI